LYHYINAEPRCSRGEKALRCAIPIAPDRRARGSSCTGTPTDVTLPAGSVCGGLDGEGHIGYAAQTGLATFGSDVFTAPSGDGFMPPIPTNPGEGTPEAPLAVALPALALLAMAGFVVRRRRKAVA